MAAECADQSSAFITGVPIVCQIFAKKDFCQNFRIYNWSAHCLPDFCQKRWPEASAAGNFFFKGASASESGAGQRPVPQAISFLRVLARQKATLRQFSAAFSSFCTFQK